MRVTQHLPSIQHGYLPDAALPCPAHLSASPGSSSPPSVSLQGMDVSGIIQAWTEELERQAQAFVRHVGTVAEWDRHILQNKHALLQLEAEMTKVGCSGASPTSLRHVRACSTIHTQ